MVWQVVVGSDWFVHRLSLDVRPMAVESLIQGLLRLTNVLDATSAALD